jgi:Protein of unknown function (DUF1499)
MKKRWTWAVLLILGVATYGLLEWTVEDWTRDFSHNSASTDNNSADPDLLPVTSAPTADAAERAIIDATLSLKGWEFGDMKDQQGNRVFRLTRNYPFLGIADDVTVTVTNVEDTVVIQATSESRSSWGDLGRNPRNLKVFLRKVRELLWKE